MFKNFSASALGISGHQSEMIELTLTYGFESLEVNMAEFVGRVKLRGMEYARRLIDSAKVRVGTFPLPVDWEAGDETFQTQLAALPEIAQTAVDIGCTRCTATLSSAGDKRPYHENFEFHKERFTAIAKALEPTGVRLGVGFQAAEYLRKDKEFQFIHDFDALTLLVNMVGLPSMGLLLDAWDLVAGGGSIETIKNLSVDQIVAVQVAEMAADVAPADLDKNSRLLPGVDGGKVDVAAVLGSLKDLGYEGPVTVKASKGIFHTRRRDLIARQTADALDMVWRAADLPSTYRQFTAGTPVVPVEATEAPKTEEAATEAPKTEEAAAKTPEKEEAAAEE